MCKYWQASRAVRVIAGTFSCILALNLWAIRLSRSETTHSADEQVQEAFDKAYQNLKNGPRSAESLQEAMRTVGPALQAQRAEVDRQQKVEQRKLAPLSKGVASRPTMAAEPARKSPEVEIDPGTVPKEVIFAPRPKKK